MLETCQRGKGYTIVQYGHTRVAVPCASLQENLAMMKLSIPSDPWR
jgi:hypothetical protein